ncbi:FAD/NAD(P)-binding oxidoreductase [Paraburkholderia acidicola]|uniref:FAD/NAD(P)-binding oxidoreductase n=1 Tax=Paraburkholderia acidicola TaxID=1912599 RepID=A0A2A4ER58_9BURK|nr:FAD-dependent oxidoreductase [Paraburkholderia acidicola]PCE22774.1 FAD/NAD(P)-binding oxidoreductase [Paraburkholderia acidicola]
MNEHYDIVIVGAGPAGLSAARAAARSGARIAVLDDNPHAGGQVWRQGPAHPPRDALRERLAALADYASQITLWPSTRIVAPLDARGLLVESAERGGATITYDRLILATGARERLLPFAGWTLPGVTGAGGLQALIKGGMPVRGERIVIAGSGPLLLAAFATARDAGAQVLAVVEQAPQAALVRFGVSLAVTPSKLWQAFQLTHGFVGSRYWSGSVVRAARGAERVEAVEIRRADGRAVTLACDRVACGYGLTPNVEVARALGCAIRADGSIAVDDAQRTSVDGVYAAGECTGIGGVELACVEGAIAGWAAGGGAGSSTHDAARLRTQRVRWQRFAARLHTTFALGEAALATPPDDTLLCRCEDVTCGEVRAQPDWRAARLHTRCGMGACQGRVCGTAVQTLFGWDVAQWRPPFGATRIGTLMAADGAPVAERGDAATRV